MRDKEYYSSKDSLLGKQKYRLDPNLKMYVAQQEQERIAAGYTRNQMDVSQPSTKDERSLESKARPHDNSVNGPLAYDRSGGSRSNFDVKVFTNNNISGNLGDQANQRAPITHYG